MRKFFDKFAAFDFVLISMMAAIGIAIKPIIVPLVHIVTGPLFIPGGAVAGGFYMMWLVLGCELVGKRGTATLIGAVQAIIVLSTGVFGTHGVLSLLTYTLPGIMIDLVFLLLPKNDTVRIRMFFAGIAANVCGTLLSNMIFFRLPLIPLMLGLSAAALSGGLGGWLAYLISTRVKKLGI